MKFTRRIKFFLLGFGIGLIATLIIFRGRGCEWLPNERVLSSIRASRIYYTPADSCTMASNNISKKDIFLLLENGDVNFGESKTKPEIKPYKLNSVEKESECKKYIIESDEIKVAFNLFERDSVVFINLLNTNKNTNSCSDKSSKAMALYMPNDMTLEKLKSNKLRIEKTAKCEMQCYDLTEADVDSLFTYGKVLFNNSYPNKKPNPLYFIELKKDSEKFIFWIEQGATKTRLNRIAKLHDEVDKSETYSIDWLFTEKKDCDCQY